MDASEETNWNYYRREIDFFESPLSALIPKSIGYPQYLGHTKLQDGTELFWNSDLGDLEKNVWTWSDCLHATELLAELNSVDYSKTDGYQWLNRSSMEGWLEFYPTFFEPLYPRFIRIISNDSRLAFAFERFGKFMLEQNKLKDELRRLRQCFVHGDFNLNNLVVVSGGNTRLTALDWQQCGVNAIGSEVASIFNTASELKVIKPDLDKFNEICAIYMKRFNELNKENPVLLKDIRYAVALMGYFILLGVGLFFNQPDPAKSDAENDEKLKSLLIEFAEGPLALYAEVLHEFL
jgi:thiamine kinase-like enzyme